MSAAPSPPPTANPNPQLTLRHAPTRCTRPLPARKRPCACAHGTWSSELTRSRRRATLSGHAVPVSSSKEHRVNWHDDFFGTAPKLLDRDGKPDEWLFHQTYGVPVDVFEEVMEKGSGGPQRILPPSAFLLSTPPHANGLRLFGHAACDGAG